MEETTAKRGLACAKFEKAVMDFADEILDGHIPYEIDEKAAESICRAGREAIESYAVAKDYAIYGFVIAYSITMHMTSKGIGIAGPEHTAPVVDGSSAIPAPSSPSVTCMVMR